MGTRTRNLRDYRVTIRLTENEHKQLLRQMERSGYLSMSRYFRVRCLDGKTDSAKEIRGGVADVADAINFLSDEISKIGANYNKVVKDFRQKIPSLRMSMPKGASMNTITYFLQQLNTKTLEVKALMENIIVLYKDSTTSTNDQNKH